MRLRVFLFCVVVAVAGCGSQTTDTAPSSSEAASTSSTSTTQPPPIPEDLLVVETVQALGFSVSRPVDWTPEIELDVRIASFYSPPIPNDPFTENFNIAVIDVPDDLSFEVYVQNDARALGQSSGVEIVDSGLITLDGEAAATVRVRTTVDGVQIGLVRAIALHDGEAYEFSFFASEEEMDRWLPIIEQFLGSFRFLD